MIQKMTFLRLSDFFAQTFRIRHRPGDHLELRVGVHTGEADEDAIDRTVLCGCRVFSFFFFNFLIIL